MILFSFTLYCSVTTEHLETDAIRDNKDNRLLLHQKRRHRLTERNHQKVQPSEEKVLLEKVAELRADFSSEKVYEPVM